MTDHTEYTLDAVPLLGDLSPAERQELAKLCRWKHYAAQEQIIDNQEHSRDLYFVTRGEVRVVNYSVSGREVTLVDIPLGGYFGELAAIDGQPRSASVMARFDTTVTAALSPEHFIRVIRAHPEIGLQVIRNLARVVRVATDRIMDLSTLGANNRVHAELLRQARAASDDGHTAVIRPIPLHSDIASRVSTTRETVARVLNELARSHVVKRDKDSLVVLDIDELQQLVEDVRGA